MKIACISDIHGNLYALEKALKYINTLNIDEIIFLGDAVGYIPGVQVVKRLKELNITCLQGNHEDMLLKRNFSPERDKFYQHAETYNRAEPDIISEISSWPETFQHESVTFFHASPNDHLYEYVYPDTDLDAFVANVEGHRYCVMGHTHRPFIRTHKDIVFINTGSIGLPRDDGRYGAFAVIDTKSDIVNIMRFDISAEIMQSINEFGPVHSSVLSLTSRRSKSSLIGEILHE